MESQVPPDPPPRADASSAAGAFSSAASVAVIINPTAGPPGSRLSPPEATLLLQQQAFEVETLVTTRPQEATELAARAAERHPVVVAVGGDGTLHEVAMGLLGTTAALALLPCGSGNDFAFALGIDTAEAGAAAAGRRHIRRIDVAYLNDWPFFNTVGLFLSGLVAARARRIWRGAGRLRYTLAAASAVITYRSQMAVWQLDGEVTDRRHRWLLAEIANGPRAGGEFLLAPDADPGDGLLDFVLVRSLPLWVLARLFPAAARGERLEHPSVYRPQATGATLTTEAEVPIHLDGEPTILPAGEYRVRLEPGALTVLAPAAGRTTAGNSQADWGETT